jgi:hypothetical protein
MSFFSMSLEYRRWMATLVVLGVLVVPTLARATGSGGGTVDGTAGEGVGDVGSGEGAGSGGEGTASDPTSGSTSGATSGDTEDPGDPDEDEKGCSIGARGSLPGMMVLALLGLHAIRRRH